MSSASVSLAVAALALAGAGTAQARELRVCADPNNLPFSDKTGSGFENRIAAVVADDLHADVKFEWAPQWRGFVRKTLNAGLCDVIPGVPAKFERVRATRPYYVGSYVFVQRFDAPPLTSFDDPVLKTARIGVQLVGNDAANTPPMDALAKRGIFGNVQGFMVIGDWSKPNPLEPIMSAVADTSIDVALVWGPVAGYFARRESIPLRVTAMPDEANAHLSFAIAMGVRKADVDLAAEIDRAIERRKSDIDAILDEFAVPRGQLALSSPDAAP